MYILLQFIMILVIVDFYLYFIFQGICNKYYLQQMTFVKQLNVINFEVTFRSELYSTGHFSNKV